MENESGVYVRKIILSGVESNVVEIIQHKTGAFVKDSIARIPNLWVLTLGVWKLR